MAASHGAQDTIETIVRLAEEIGQASPECALKAMQIADLARGLGQDPDEETIRDTLDAQVLDGELSDVGSRNAARRVVAALKD